MDLKDNLRLSQCLIIKFTDGFVPDTNSCIPGLRSTRQVVIRYSKVLSVGEIRVTFYGISDAYIHDKISGIRADICGRGFLFQEIKTVTSNPVSLEPNISPAHGLPFQFIVPHSTMPMTQNEANFINKWQSKPPFAGAHDMHPLPPSCKFFKKALLEFTESSVLYRLEANLYEDQERFLVASASSPNSAIFTSTARAESGSSLSDIHITTSDEIVTDFEHDPTYTFSMLPWCTISTGRQL
ncbi:MAG: hypothetical protein Q9201_002155 [Fulgogasparrea decipioides]